MGRGAWEGVFGAFVVNLGGGRICGEIVGGFLEGKKGKKGRKIEREEERGLRMGWGIWGYREVQGAGAAEGCGGVYVLSAVGALCGPQLPASPTP